MILMPFCREVSRTLAEAVDDIPWHKRVMLRLHLSMCDHCSRFQRQLNLIGKAFRSFRPDDASVKALEAKILERLKKR